MKTKHEVVTKERADTLAGNADLIQQNLDLTNENEKMQQEIQILLKRIELNNLLKDVDVDEMRIVEKNTQTMNGIYKNILKQWNEIQEKKIEYDKYEVVTTTTTITK